jgi:hypothetical protein
MQFFRNFNNNSSILLKNCGFESDFFNKIEENIKLYKNNNIRNINSFNNIKKIKSENDITSLNCMQRKRRRSNERKIYEAEDKDIYNQIFEYNMKNFYKNSNCNSFFTTFSSKDNLDRKNSCEIIKNNNYLIKAYHSKLKKKYDKIYELNSVNLKEKNKFKLYHKCCYPGCNRTFSSSGWLKSHLNIHLKQIHNSNYCKLFENYSLKEKFNNKNNYTLQ